MPFFNSLLYYQTSPAIFEKNLYFKVTTFHYISFYQDIFTNLLYCYQANPANFHLFQSYSHSFMWWQFISKDNAFATIFFTLLTALLALFSNTHHCPFLFSQESLCSYTPTIYFSFPQSIVVLCVSRGSFCWLPPVFIGINKEVWRCIL